MEERRNLLKKMETDNTRKGFLTTAKTYREKSETIQLHVDKMKEILFASKESV
jgi:two-component system chemotaxis response regulator CheB